MTNHYYSKKPTVEHDERYINYFYNNKKFIFKTDSGVFSKSRIDFGTSLLIEAINIEDKVKILDLGCGYGAIGIISSSLLSRGEMVLTDINERAVMLANENILLNKELINKDVKISAIQSNGFDNITDINFDYIFLNPPIRAGKAIVYELYSKAYHALEEKGELWIVIQKKQGAPSSITQLKEIFSKVEVVVRDKGYYIVKSIK